MTPLEMNALGTNEVGTHAWIAEATQRLRDCHMQFALAAQSFATATTASAALEALVLLRQCEEGMMLAVLLRGQIVQAMERAPLRDWKIRLLDDLEERKVTKLVVVTRLDEVDK